ncbi:hypothetical protein DFH07DRAFT_775502 [Mycena maculata]|uniref:Uncharacterized protein n=1 Tax=Mycena maculata TaxID=230809 RepID=A0AAD7IUA9_9AGAR|nr:hypothetical protein DFH07DRAFT_775502 [Mycena maculata]
MHDGGCIPVNITWIGVRNSRISVEKVVKGGAGEKCAELQGYTTYSHSRATLQWDYSVVVSACVCGASTMHGDRGFKPSFWQYLLCGYCDGPKSNYNCYLTFGVGEPPLVNPSPGMSRVLTCLAPTKSKGTQLKFIQQLSYYPMEVGSQKKKRTELDF